MSKRVKYMEAGFTCPECGAYNPVSRMKKVGNRDIKCRGKQGRDCSFKATVRLKQITHEYTITSTRAQIEYIENGEYNDEI